MPIIKRGPISTASRIKHEYEYRRKVFEYGQKPNQVREHCAADVAVGCLAHIRGGVAFGQGVGNDSPKHGCLRRSGHERRLKGLIGPLKVSA